MVLTMIRQLLCLLLLYVAAAAAHCNIAAISENLFTMTHKIAPQPDVDPVACTNASQLDLIKWTATHKPETVKNLEEVFNTWDISATMKFFDAVNKTKIPKALYDEMISYECINKKTTYNEFWEQMNDIWLGRSGKYVSGFHHVFLGERKKNEIKGLHNWLSYMHGFRSGQEYQKLQCTKYKANKTINFNYGQIIKISFGCATCNKIVSTMFVGTAPELEIALYTLCFITNKDQPCNVSLADNKFNIKTFSQNNTGRYLRTAFPAV